MSNKGTLQSAWAGALGEKRDIEAITTEIQFFKSQAGEAILEIGHRLIEAKEQLQHGEWLDWLRDRVEFSESTAQRFMRIAREYSNPSLVTDLGHVKALVLLALPPDEREEFAEQSHAIDGEVKAVTEMSKRELEQAVRERKEALEAKAAAEQKAEERRQQMQDALAKAEAAEADAIRAQKEKTELERKLEEMQSAEPDQQLLDTARREAAEAARIDAEATLREKIDQAAEDKAKAEAERTQAQRELDRIKLEYEQEQAALSQKVSQLEKQLSAPGSQTLAVFKTYFESVQVSLNKMLECIQNADDDATCAKLSGALGALCNKVLEQLPQEGS